jgi:DnaK suppressor protein
MDRSKSLSAKEREDIGRLLKQRRSVLENTVEHELHRGESRELQGTDDMDLDRETAGQEVDSALSKLERDTREIEAVDHALSRFESLSFGECERCGEPIGYARLLVHPTAVRCLACQQKLESNH